MTTHLTNSQVIILKTLARNPNGLTREQIDEKAQCVVDNTTLGPVYEETLDKHPESLTSLRLVLRKKLTPDMPVLYFLSESGKKAAQLYSARKRGAKDKVPADVLNPIVLRIRPLKPYSDEYYTDDDLKEIRDMLPEEYQDTPLESLKRQIRNQRKQGAYRTDRYSEPDWYKEYRSTNEARVFSQEVESFYNGCAICQATENVTVYHRRYTNLYVERVNDGIALCPACHNRNYKFMAKIPDTEPNTFVGDESDTNDGEE